MSEEQFPFNCLWLQRTIKHFEFEFEFEISFFFFSSFFFPFLFTLLSESAIRQNKSRTKRPAGDDVLLPISTPSSPPHPHPPPPPPSPYHFFWITFTCWLHLPYLGRQHTSLFPLCEFAFNGYSCCPRHTHCLVAEASFQTRWQMPPPCFRRSVRSVPFFSCRHTNSTRMG